MSLSTARSSIRGKEIGVRKVMGAGRKIIATQFFAESALCTAISFVLGYILCIVIQPFFFDFLQIKMDRSFLYHPSVLLSFIGLFIVTALLAATYPSLLLSAFKPVSVLYGKMRQGRGISLRKFFTVLQFSIAVVFIICGIVMQKQMYFFRHKDTGINRDNIVMMPFGTAVTKHYAAFKEEIRSVPGIQQFSVALHPLFKGYDMMGITPPGSDQMMLIPTLMWTSISFRCSGLKWMSSSRGFFFLQKEKQRCAQ